MSRSDEDRILDFFLGDEETQDHVVHSINAALRSNPAVHLVYGGTRSGKSTVIQEVWDDCSQGKDFRRMNPESARHCLNTDIFSELRTSLLKVVVSLTFHEGSEDLFESNSDNSHKVLCLKSDEVDVSNELRPVMDALRNLPAAIASFSIMLDSPNLNMPLFPGVQLIGSKKKHENTERCLVELCQAYPELLVHRMPYNYDRVKDTFWRARQEGVKSSILEEYFSDHFNVDIKHPAIIRVIKAIKERNKAKYEIAFQQIPSVKIQR